MLLALGAPSATAQAQEHEITWEAVYTADFLANTRGGLARGARRLDNLDLVAAYEGPNGVTAQGSLLYNNDAVFSENLVGDLQVVSNIDTDEALRVFELWVAKSFARDAATLKLGLVDLNSEFDVQEVGSLFLNSSHGIGPDFSQSGLNGPSIFPVTSLALTARFAPTPVWTVHAGVFDAVPGDPDTPRRTVVRLSEEEGALLVAEVERRFGGARLALGAWRYTARFEALEAPHDDRAPARIRQGRGAYATLEGDLIGKNSVEDKGLSGWIRVGTADQDVYPVAAYVGGGLVYTGLTPGRARDQIGVAVAHARIGDGARRAAEAGAARPEEAETTFEFTYRLQMAKRLVLQPDVQYVIDPGVDPASENALVVGLRVELDLSR